MLPINIDRNPLQHQGSDINIELYSSGFIDGLMGLDAQLPHYKDYWDGYCLGYREYCCGLLGVKISPDQIDPESYSFLAA